MDRYDDTLFVVLKTVLRPHESVQTARRIAETGEIMVFVGPDFVVAVRHGDHSGLADLRRELEREHVQLALGPYGVLQAIIRDVVEHYLDVIEPLRAISMSSKNRRSRRTGRPRSNRSTYSNGMSWNCARRLGRWGPRWTP